MSNYQDSLIKLQIGFNESRVNVSMLRNTSAASSIRGDLLVIAFLILRIMSITRDAPGKLAVLEALSTGVDGIDHFSEQILNEYAEEYKYERIRVTKNDKEFSAKKHFTLEMAYDLTGHVNKYRAKGFGMLGKGVDFHAYVSILLLCQYIVGRYSDTNTIEKISRTIQMGVETIQKLGKLNAKDEYRFVEVIVNDAMNR